MSLLTRFLCRVDVHEDKEKNLVTATFELPGINKQDVNIDVRDNVLTVSGESKQETEKKENGYVVRERHFGRFSRSLPVPAGIKVRPSFQSTRVHLTHARVRSPRKSRRPWRTVF